MIFNSFSWVFGVNLSEIKKPLTEFTSFNEFFIRELKENSRKIDSEALVSPCDSKVASFGKVGTTLESIKGSDYSFTKFLTGVNDCSFEDYKNSLKKNPENELYYITLYLAPGDYHRFHSPTDWKINYRRHLYGYLLGVFSLNLWRRKDIFTINERVVYFGQWKYGAMHYVAVGAYNVGSITVGCDEELKTNKFDFYGPLDTFSQKEIKCSKDKGEEFGMFNTGSTIVLIFEAPKDIQWMVKEGDRVQVGNKLINLL